MSSNAQFVVISGGEQVEPLEIVALPTGERRAWPALDASWLARREGTDESVKPWRLLAELHERARALASEHNAALAAVRADGRLTERGKRERVGELATASHLKLAQLGAELATLAQAARQGLALAEGAALDRMLPRPARPFVETVHERIAAEVAAGWLALKDELRGAETRAWLRGLPDDRRESLLVGNSDTELLRHVVGVPAEMSGTGEALHELLRGRALEAAGGDELVAAREQVDAVAAVSGAIQLAGAVVGGPGVVQP